MSNTVTLPIPGQERSTPAKTAQLRTWLRSLDREVWLVLTLMGVGLVAHAFNMFHYPSFTFLDDEGIYAGQARAVLEQHQLSPYTYFYDHAPAGWILLAIWYKISGGLHTFGTAIDSGRVLMLLLHMAMIPLLYRVTRKLSDSWIAAAFATLLFSLSPLAIFYQRMVLLDNIMLFWVLLSLDLLLDGWGRLSRLMLGGAAFGMAIVSKETALFLIPAFLVLAIQQRWQHQGRFAVTGWLIPMAVVVSFYPLFALLKGELFPSGLASFTNSGEGISGGTGGVSLIDALIWQSTRDGGGMFNLNNDFWQLLRSDWVPRDAFLFVGGAAAVGLNLIRGIRDRRVLVTAFLGLMPLIYLARGGIVLNYYVLFAIPFLCLNIAVMAGPLLDRLSQRFQMASILAILAIMVVGYWVTGPVRPLYAEQPDQAGREALTWIDANVPAQSYIVGRDDLWTDLHEPNSAGIFFPNMHSHWKVGSDPAVRDDIFHNDWHTVDYLIVSPGMRESMQASGNTVGLEALNHAHLVKTWTSSAGSEGLHPQQIVQLYKVDKSGPTETQMRVSSAAYLSATFEHNGAYMDSAQAVTSEAESYALLRAVWSGDRASFDRAWSWTQQNLRESTGLLGWTWHNGKITDPHTATDADSDTALALLMASARWNDPTLRAEGTRIVQAIWQHEVVTVGSTSYITAGDWAGQGNILAIDPSYFSPYAYRIFAAVDHTHNWQAVIDSGYRVLFDASSAPLNGQKSAGLPPDWIGLDRATAKVVPLPLGSSKGDTTVYGYDAARTFWRIALDLQWWNDGRAKAFLNQAGFLKDEVNSPKANVSAVYNHDGTIKEKTPSMVSMTGALAALLTLDPGAANTLYAGQLVGGSTRTSTGLYWGDPNDLYTQEWGWFGTALYANALPNLWLKP